MSMIQGGQLVGKVLKAYGVDVVFTLCGGHVMNIYQGCVDEGIKIIDVRHEQATTHCADGWARLTHKPGVAIVTAGPGVTDAITGLVNAQQAESPILLIGGQAPMFQRERGSLQEINHTDLVRAGCKWSITCFEPNRIPEYLHKAFRIMTSGVPGPVFLELPVDTLLNNVKIDEAPIIPPPRSSYLTSDDPSLVEEAAKLIAASKKPMIMGGATIYAHQAWAELQRFCETANIPTYLNSMGRGCLPTDHPNFYALTRKHAFKNADLIVVAGSPIDFRLGYGKSFNPDAKVIQLEQDAEVIGGNNRKADVELIGNLKAIFNQLSDAVDTPSGAKDSGWIDELTAKENAAKEGQMEGITSDASPVHPLRFAAEIGKWVDDETIIIGDGGNIVAHTSKVVPVNRPGQWLDPGKFGCLGVGVPFAISARLAHPDKKLLLVLGDGSVGFNGFEFDTAVRFGLPFVSIVGNDGAWAQIRGLQQAMLPPEHVVASKLNVTRYDKFVEALGGHGEYVTRPEDIVPALERCYASGKPSLVNVEIDAEWNAGQFSYSAMGM